MAFVRAYAGNHPQIADDVFLAESATVIGDVVIGSGASIWYGAVLRGDVGRIRVGARTNVQDLAVLHMTGGVSNVEIGDDVTIGHGAVIHGAGVGDGCLVGMGCILLDGARIGRGAVVAAGTLVPPRFEAPDFALVQGHPGRVVRILEEAERERAARAAADYVALAGSYRALSREE